MSEHETASLFYQIVDVANGSLANFLTIVFAMLVASYLAAPKLDRTLSILVVTLFTIYCLGFINEIYSEYRDFAALGIQIHELSRQAGSSLTWHGAAAEGSIAQFKRIPQVILIMCILTYFATMWFFLHMKRTNGK